MLKILVLLMVSIHFASAQTPNVGFNALPTSPTIATPNVGVGLFTAQQNANNSQNNNNAPALQKTFSQAMGVNIWEDKKPEEDRPEKEIIIKKFNNETFYHYSQTDQFIEPLLDTFDLNNDRTQGLKNYLKLVTHTLALHDLPSTIEKKVKTSFTKSEIKELKKILLSPFMQKFFNKLYSSEAVQRNRMYEIQNADPRNFKGLRMMSIEEIANSTGMMPVASNIKAIFRKNIISYRLIDEKKKKPELTDIMKKQALKEIEYLKNNQYFMNYYNRVLYFTLSEFRRSELMEAARLLRHPLMDRFFKLRTDVINHKLANYRPQLIKKLYETASMSSYKNRDLPAKLD